MEKLYKMVDYETITILYLLTDNGWKQIGSDDYACQYIQRHGLEELSGKHREKYRGILELGEIYYVGHSYEREGHLHNSKGNCPTCGAPGTFDISTKKDLFLDWISYNTSSSTWECHDCWLK